MRDEEKFTCSRCSHSKPGAEFRWQQKNGRWYRRYCLLCEREKRKDWQRSNRDRASSSHREFRRQKALLSGEDAVRWWFSRHLNQWRLKTKRLKLPDVDLDAEHILGLFRNQEGRCYYSGVLLEWSSFGVRHAAKQQRLASLDRMSPALGYTRGNVVLCTFQMNATKGSRTVEEFVGLCRQVAERFKQSEIAALPL